jgi:hypothetical protein
MFPVPVPQQRSTTVRTGAYPPSSTPQGFLDKRHELVGIGAEVNRWSLVRNRVCGMDHEIAVERCTVGGFSNARPLSQRRLLFRAA